MRARRVAFVLVGAALAATPTPASAQAVGEEFPVNTYTTGYQWTASRRAVTADADGSFVAVWTGVGPGDRSGAFGQRFDSAGAPAGHQFRVNSYIKGNLRSATVASDPAGNFLVVWDGAGAGDTWGIFGRRYDSGGAVQGPEFRVNTWTTANQRIAPVAADASGNFVVVWESIGQDGSGYGVFGQRYDSDGSPRGSEFRVNAFTTGSQRVSSIASDASGNFVVVWEGSGKGDLGGIFGRRFSSSGTPLGDEFRVNSYTTSAQRGTSVASDASGNFVVVWESLNQGGDPSYGIFGQRYDSQGRRRGGEFHVNTYTFSGQQNARVASDAGGNFLVTWDSWFAEGFSSLGVYGQLYDSDGVAQGGEFQINTHTTQKQSYASAWATGPSQFVVVWSSYEQDDTETWGVFGQRFDFE